MLNKMIITLRTFRSKKSLNQFLQRSGGFYHTLFYTPLSEYSRIKWQAQRRSPYPTHTKLISNSTNCESQNSTIMTDHTAESSASVPTRFGYATPEYRQGKVRFKNINTSWYTYRTLGPLDYPTNIPPNHPELQFNDIFLHIDEHQMGKICGQLRIPKLLKCVKMWVCNGVSWQRISFGEEHLIGDGDVLCISLKYNHKIVRPTWITSKSMKRVLKDLHRDI